MKPDTALLIFHIVGFTSAVCAALGIGMTISQAMRVFRGKIDLYEVDESLFRKFFIRLSTISIVYNVMLAVFAMELISGRSVHWLLYLAFLYVPLIIVVVVGRLWRKPEMGVSLGAASGIGIVGITPPFFCLLPIWGPIAIWIAA